MEQVTLIQQLTVLNTMWTVNPISGTVLEHNIDAMLSISVQA